MVSAAVTAALPVTLTEDGMLHVAGLVGLVSVVVTAQLKFTVPVKPPAGVTLIVEVFPVVAPAARANVLLAAERA